MEDLLPALAEEIGLDEDNLLLFLMDRYGDAAPGAHLRWGRFDLNTTGEEECKTLFRFEKADIPRLMRAFRIPDQNIGSNQIHYSGIEGLCVVLRRLSYPNRYHDIIPIFGRSKGELCIIFNEVLTLIHNNFGNLLSNLNQTWLASENLSMFADAIHNKGGALTNCWGFIDGTVRPICRPTHFQREVYIWP